MMKQNERWIAQGLGARLTSLMRVNAPLTVTALVGLVALVGTLFGLLLDPRVITGAPAWLKPSKFLISSSIYGLTLVWLLGFVEGRKRWVSLVANGTAVGLVGELLIICLQAARGTTSHFNMSTPFDAALWSAMGLLIVLVWIMSMVAAGLLLRQRMAEPAFAWGIRLGLLVTVVGMGLAFLIASPDLAQLAARAVRSEATRFGGHSVGVADGGPGIPGLGWSTVGGDLRIGHFVGLHALQVLPLLGWLLGRVRFPGLQEPHRVTLAWIGGAAYLALMLLVTWQALRGQSVVRPDALTLTASAAVAGAALLAAGGVLAHARLRLAPSHPVAVTARGRAL